MRDVWDPLSTKQTKLATFLLQRLIDDIPTITRDSKQTKVFNFYSNHLFVDNKKQFLVFFAHPKLISYWKAEKTEGGRNVSRNVGTIQNC